MLTKLDVDLAGSRKARYANDWRTLRPPTAPGWPCQRRSGHTIEPVALLATARATIALVVVTATGYGYVRKDGVAVVPIGALTL